MLMMSFIQLYYCYLPFCISTRQIYFVLVKEIEDGARCSFEEKFFLFKDCKNSATLNAIKNPKH